MVLLILIFVRGKRYKAGGGGGRFRGGIKRENRRRGVGEVKEG